MLSKKASQLLREQILSILAAGRPHRVPEENLLSEARRTMGVPISKMQLRRQIRELMDAGIRIDTIRPICEDPKYQLGEKR